jgi:hypothetical protein
MWIVSNRDWEKGLAGAADIAFYVCAPLRRTAATHAPCSAGSADRPSADGSASFRPRDGAIKFVRADRSIC